MIQCFRRTSGIQLRALVEETDEGDEQGLDPGRIERELKAQLCHDDRDDDQRQQRANTTCRQTQRGLDPSVIR